MKRKSLITLGAVAVAAMLSLAACKEGGSSNNAPNNNSQPMTKVVPASTSQATTASNAKMMKAHCTNKNCKCMMVNGKKVCPKATMKKAQQQMNNAQQQMSN